MLNKCREEGLGVWGNGHAWNWLSHYWPMAGYWSSSSFRFYWPRRGQYTAILIEEAWSTKDLLYSQKDNIFLGTSAKNPEPTWLANQNSGFVSSCPLARIQPYNNWTLSSRVNYSPEFFWLTCALICDPLGTKKLSSRLFSRPDWLPLGLRGWRNKKNKAQKYSFLNSFM